MKNKYIPTAAGLYLNYLIHGMGVLLITLNMAHLQEQWGNRQSRRIDRYIFVRYW
ncbi:inner membrane transporter YdiM [Klebsiella pneumoniae]|nr:inner membrane transporter YdiM [Klebsiella pneumoniae]KLZ27263.1 inner membrane transporter YdiM [Klebsiella pneumoniae]KLZ37860.1 inner membrane transporter YdiM [Klebsiella pneumoniae]KLZ48638.1 inner membrane transporter YdiM [Klebsiella pneumoniae]KMA61976.1 inner membrane transporter YdiM [Klebsiella pneumoniae]